MLSRSPDVARRSARQRVAPLKWWANERILLCPLSGTPKVVSGHSPDVSDITNMVWTTILCICNFVCYNFVDIYHLVIKIINAFVRLLTFLLEITITENLAVSKWCMSCVVISQRCVCFICLCSSRIFRQVSCKGNNDLGPYWYV